MKKSIIVLLHIGYWAIYLTLISSFFLAMPGLNKPSLGRALFFSKLTLFAVLPAVICFYIFYTILFRRFLYKKKILMLLLFSFLTPIACGLIALFALYAALGSRYVFYSGWSQAIAELIALSFLALVHGIIALVIKGFITWYSEIRLKDELKKKNFEMELELIKSQINPHFLFNTINNIDVLIGKDPEKASEYLNKLSDIMRFMLYETRADQIPLSKELSYIEKYIDLQRIRTNTPEAITYSVHGNAENLTIAPMLFIPFIENAFKHSENRKPGNVIEVKIDIEQNKLSFYCENDYVKSKVSQEKGLGNELIKKRLRLLYPNRHKLEISNDVETYKTHLELYYAN